MKMPSLGTQYIDFKKSAAQHIVQNDFAEYKRFQKTCQEESGNFFANSISFFLVLAAAESTKEKFFKKC
jgi:hypothetical protein